MARFNPYIIGPPVRDTAFYGREKLINVVRDTLTIPTVNLIVFYGQRRIGKTSLLQNLNGQAELNDFIFIYYDAFDIADKTSLETLYYFSQKIAQATGLKAPTKAQLEQDEGLFQREFLTHAYAAVGNKRLVLLLDEFDIFEYKRKIGDSIGVIDHLLKTEANLAFIVALGRGKEEFQTQLALILKAGYWVKVSLLEEDEARRLITEPAHDQLYYLPEAVVAVLDLNAGHPYYTQLLCYEIFNELRIEGGNQVRLADVQRAAAKALDTGSGGFGWLWEGLAPAERLVLALVAEAAEERLDHLVTEEQLSQAFAKNRIHRRGIELTGALNRLIDLDIIERKGPVHYHYVVELIRRWVYEKHPVSQERDNTLTLLSKRAMTEFTAGQAASDPSAVIGHFRAAVAANPNHIEAQLALAETLFREGQVDEAVEAYEAAYWLDEIRAKVGLERAKAAQLSIKTHRPRSNLISLLIGKQESKQTAIQLSPESEPGVFDWRQPLNWERGTISNNPYNISPPAVGSQFFGRAALFEAILRTFDSPQNAITIIGRARLGKTSMLRELANWLPAEDYVSVYWALKENPKTLQLLSAAIAKQTQLPEPNYSTSLDLDDFQLRFLSQVLEQVNPKRLVLLLDDIDALDSQDEANSLITSLQMVIIKYQMIAFVLSTNKKFQDLPLPFMRIGKQVRVEELSFLTPQETLSLITEPSKNTPVRYSKEAVRAIAALSAGHPYFTQLICHEIFKYAVKENITLVDVAMVEATLPHIFKIGGPDFQQSIAGLNDSQLYTLAACAIVFNETGFVLLKHLIDTLHQYQVVVAEWEVNRALNELQKHDILQANEGVFKFSLPMLARWLVARYPLDKVISQQKSWQQKLFSRISQSFQNDTARR